MYENLFSLEVAIGGESYSIAAMLFLRLLGAIYFITFGSFLLQCKGLFCSNGILPIADYIAFLKERIGKWRFFRIPTLYWFDASDQTLIASMALGTLLGLALFFGLYPAIVIPLLYILYISLVSTGQDFLSFGWDVFLLEITINAFLLSLTSTPNPMVWISLNFLLFRFHIQAGAVKFQSRDRNWRNFCALSYHYESQPLPNTTAWFVHHFPLWFHKLSCAMMYFTELVVPFLMFGTQEMRLIAFFFFVGLQLFIWLTGNFSYLNHMTVALCVILISNSYLSWAFSPPEAAPTPLLLNIFVTLAASLLLTLQAINLAHHFFPNRTFSRILYKIYPYHLANRYGIFAVMTTERYEVIIEGSNDGETWKEYTCRYKPSQINRRPKRVSPYQPRLDWQLWFLPFQSYNNSYWFQQFLACLLQGSPDVLALMDHNPFPEKPPTFIRASFYLYTFTHPKTRKETGAWWDRTYIQPYSPILSLPNPVENQVPTY